VKIGVAGKGGVGKTFIAGTLARFFAKDFSVIAIDNDPSMNLIYSLGMDPNLRNKITPISQMTKLIEERTTIQGFGPGIYNANPTVSDIPDKFKIIGPDNLKLLVVGTIETPSSGCFCAPNALVRALLSDLILNRNEVIIIDFEAGLEHLGRGTSKGLDVMLIVTQSYKKSLDLSERILNLCKKMEMKNIFIVGNNLEDENSENVIYNWAKEHYVEVIITIPRDPKIEECEVKSKAPFDYAYNFPAVLKIKELYIKLKEIYVKSIK